MSEKQVDRSHYWNESYLCRERFLHYREQFLTIVKLNPSSILEAGPGAGLLSSMLKCICGKVVTVDFAEDLNPDIVADIKSVPVDDASFDMVCSFQLLEHIPWGEVPDALREMARIAKRYVLFSVPNNNYMKRPFISFQISFFGLSFGRSLYKRIFRGVSNPEEHLWEIGVHPVTSELVLDVIKSSGLACNRNWVDTVNHYFLCEKVALSENKHLP